MSNTIVKTEEVLKKLLKILNPRTREVLERRFGFGPKGTRETLEAIGGSYGITRERVRQIEAHALSKLRQNPTIADFKEVFSQIKDEIQKRGGIVREDLFLDEMAKTPSERNGLRLLLILASGIFYLKEDSDFFHERLAVSREIGTHSETVLKRLYETLDQNSDPASVDEMTSKLTVIAKELSYPYPPEEIKHWLLISKRVAKNQFGEWGLSDAPTIRPRGVRDLAYLVMRRHGSPMHFREVAGSIKQLLGKKAHDQTVHNELIKDGRFVLVGRGLYALNEWGYQPGVVRDVISAMLVKHGPLTKDELVKKVLQERHVKDNTIFINLQNKKHFKKDADGRYHMV